ncbi:MAG: hypothetical protein ACRC6V_09860 [Bacteroidales bacterium]
MNHYMLRNLVTAQKRKEVVMTTKAKPTNLEQFVKALPRVTLPSGELIYAQDGGGDVYSFSGMPTRGSTNATIRCWYGLDKTRVGDCDAFPGWHTERVKYDGAVMTRYPYDHGGEKVTVEKEAPPLKASMSSLLVERYPNRAFGELPDDYGIAIAYSKKVANARERNIAFELTFDQFRELFLHNTCCISGEELGHHGRPTGMDQHSLDRLDPAKGYVSGNVVVMAADLNSIKADLDKFLTSGISDEHMLKLIYKVENVLRKRIKETQAKEETWNEEASSRTESFEQRFAIFPK